MSNSGGSKVAFRLEKEFSRYRDRYRRKQTSRRIRKSLVIGVICHYSIPLILVIIAACIPTFPDAALKILDQMNLSDNPVNDPPLRDKAL